MSKNSIIDLRIDPASERHFRRMMELYVRAKGTDINSAIKNLAQGIGFGLMRKTQPYGASAAAGKKFEKSIGIQVYKGAARVAAQNVPEAHRKSRNTRGRVLGKLYRVKGSPNYETKGGPEWEKKKKANAGMLKAAWVVAAEKIPGNFGKRKIPKYIKRHLNNRSFGTVSIRGRGLSTDVDLTNTLSYSSKKNTDVESGIKEGYKAVIFQVKNLIEGTGRLRGRKNTII